MAKIGNVLALIVEGNGGNDLVKTKRGKQFQNLRIIPEFLKNYAAVTAAAAATTTPTVTVTYRYGHSSNK